MPIMSGHEATAKIRQQEAKNKAARTPIIAVTAHTMKGDKERCLEPGMDDYLSKPLPIASLHNALIKWGLVRSTGKTAIAS